MQYWEDLPIGRSFQTDELTLSAEDIIEFATDFDPQPYHLDPLVAAQSIFGGHCASGWQVCALMMRLLVDTLSCEGVVSAGSAGVRSLRWLKPVFAGDRVRAEIEITQRNSDSELPNHGIVECAIDVRNQRGDSVILVHTALLIQRKQGGAGA